MLKKIKVGFVGVALIVVLLIAAATLNVGSVNASPTDKNDPSNLKWVTKYVPGYGNVTAREDMFVGDGDDIYLVANKDYKEKGIITPIFEKIPEINYVVVDTPYGKVEVTPETYKKLGEEKIIANQKAFIEQRNELIKMGMIHPSLESFNSADNQTTIQTIPQAQTDSSNTLQAMQTPSYSNSPREDAPFSPKNGYQPRYIYGQIYPLSGSWVPSGIVSYHELEVTINNGDICEFISQHVGTQRNVWVCLYGNEKHDPMPEFLNVNGPIEYYFNYNPQTHDYAIVLYNPATGETRPEYYNDGTQGTYISAMDASTELYYDTMQTFNAASTIEQWVTQVGYMYYNPTDVFNSLPVRNPHQYVNVSVSPNNGHYIASHLAGSQVP